MTESFGAGYVVPFLTNLVLAAVIFFGGRFVIRLLMSLVRKLFERSGWEDILINFVCSIINALLLLVVIVAALDQLGVNTTSLIALIGAAGLAVGLALQGSLQNFAAGVMLTIFRPFKAGDYVEAGGTGGTVEAITIFTTTLRTPDNREVIVPNGSIYSGTITNFSARPTRRIDLVFGVSYGDDLKKAKEVIGQILSQDERILDDPEPLIAVAELGDSSVNFYVRPWVNSGDYWAVRFDLTEKIKLAFDENGISIPFPQMDVHVEKTE